LLGVDEEVDEDEEVLRSTRTMTRRFRIGETKLAAPC